MRNSNRILPLVWHCPPKKFKNAINPGNIYRLGQKSARALIVIQTLRTPNLGVIPQQFRRVTAFRKSWVSMWANQLSMNLIRVRVMKMFTTGMWWSYMNDTRILEISTPIPIVTVANMSLTLEMGKVISVKMWSSVAFGCGAWNWANRLFSASASAVEG